MDPIVDPVVTILTDQPVANYLTLILVLITGWYAWHTRQTVKAMREQNERLIRPYVTVRLTRDRTDYILLVENTGRTPAKDLRLEVDQEFHCLGNSDFALSNEALFAKGIGTFPPGSEVGYTLAHTVQMMADPKPGEMPDQFSVTARYSYQGKDVEEEFEINLRQFAKNILVYRGARRELKDIRKALRKEFKKELEKSRKAMESISDSLEKFGTSDG